MKRIGLASIGVLLLFAVYECIAYALWRYWDIDILIMEGWYSAVEAYSLGATVVDDETGLAISQAVIHAVSPPANDERIPLAVSDQSGRVTFALLCPADGLLITPLFNAGLYRRTSARVVLRVSAPGYQGRLVTLDLTNSTKSRVSDLRSREGYRPDETRMNDLGFIRLRPGQE